MSSTTTVSKLLSPEIPVERGICRESAEMVRRARGNARDCDRVTLCCQPSDLPELVKSRTRMESTHAGCSVFIQ